MKQKLIFAAVLLLSCTPLLTACAGKNGTDASPGSASVGAQNGDSQAGKDPAAGVNVKEDPKDLKEAKTVIEKFFDACKNHRNDAVKGFSNIERIPDFSAVAGVNLSDEEAQNAIQSAIDTYSNLDEYKIETGSLNKAAIGTYAGYLAEAQEIGAFLRDNGDSAIADAAEKLFVPVEKIYSFPVTVTRYGASNSDKMYVIQDADGEWKVDMGLLQAMVDYMSVSKVKNANGEAKRAAEAIKTAAAGAKELNGEYRFDGDQLVSADGKTEISADAQKFADQLKAAYDFGSDRRITHLYFRMEKGELKAAAVQKDFQEIPYYGTWPEGVEEHYMYYFSSIDDAMLYAAGEYENAAPF